MYKWLSKYEADDILAIKNGNDSNISIKNVETTCKQKIKPREK